MKSPVAANTEQAPDLPGLDGALAAMLRGQQPAWQDAWIGVSGEAAAVDRIRYHGVALALIESGQEFPGWPDIVVESIREEARLQVLWEASHKDALSPLLERFGAQQVDCLMMKGTATAYLLHETPAVRRRGDSDLLIRPHQLAAARETLQESGWTRHEVDYFGQESWLFDTGMGFVHTVDLHWRSVGTPFLAKTFGDDELFETSVPLPRLCAEARTLAPPLLLLRGVLNQALHGLSGYIQGDAPVFARDRLIWLLDTALLMQRFSDADWDAVVAAAEARGMRKLCLEELRKAEMHFDATLPESVATRLGADRDATGVESYFARGSAAARLWMDVGALEGVTPRLAFLRRHVFPAEDALARRFPNAAHWPAPVLHARRIASGLKNLIGRKGG
ncbi:nucleotidyltransferase family protein [Aurantiacibacter sp. MUD61]|uniref:nucleotidyltransferase family protein n=1 Tax=Aurantiacibacter sp. MUD61 TaxID=3009083 RepID=UPI0022F00374|nr:nucleotidyltransferase family protein [Aurantiacibacter sp. MUD61]